MDDKLIPEGYTSPLSVRETITAINRIKEKFEETFSKQFNLTKVCCPLFTRAGTGVNDQLDTVKKPVVFQLKNPKEKGDDPIDVEIIQATTKWKRLALADYGFKEGEGLMTDMRGIRKDYKLDNTHSGYVDQWDWELVIGDRERTLDFLKKTVEQIYKVIREVEAYIYKLYPQLAGKYPPLPEHITFIHSDDLLSEFPDMEKDERENTILERHKAVFIIGIGYKLSNGEPHDARAPDYDDFMTPTGQKGEHHGLNGDILFWNPVVKERHEISSMGIRVDSDGLRKQLEYQNHKNWEKDYYHSRLLNNELPLCVGGGIGQSRIYMWLLRKAHIGEVQASIWPDGTREQCKKRNINLL